MLAHDYVLREYRIKFGRRKKGCCTRQRFEIFEIFKRTTHVEFSHVAASTMVPVQVLRTSSNATACDEP